MSRTIANFTTEIDNKEVTIKHTNGAYEKICITIDGVELVDQDCDIYVGNIVLAHAWDILTLQDKYPTHVKAHNMYTHGEI